MGFGFLFVSRGGGGGGGGVGGVLWDRCYFPFLREPTHTMAFEGSHSSGFWHKDPRGPMQVQGLGVQDPE